MKITAEELTAFLTREFPHWKQHGKLATLGDGWAEMSLTASDEHLRPGGTVSGPTLMGLADVAVYAALLSRIGLVPLAVTSNLNIHFLRKPAANSTITATGTMLRVGRTSAVGEVLIHSEGVDDPVAHATATYAIPQKR